MTPQMQRAHDAFENDLRLEQVIDMAVEAAITPELNRLSEALEEDLLDYLATCRLDESIKPLAEYLLANGDDEALLQVEDMINLRPDLMGFCLQVSTPVKEWEGGAATYSWGYTQLNWVYGNTYNEAWYRAVQWAEEKMHPPGGTDD